ncbi:MAG: MATE family efflux transporter [Oscillospiraceae bacterium]|nr:MATE family efflux transporter [Oscillospiraceae bacterium]
MSKNKQNPDLGTGSMPKLMAKMAIPTVVAQVVNLLYNIVDRIYIGQGVGALALTGVGLCMPLMMFMNAFAMLAGTGGAPLAAIAMGRNDKERADKILANCFTMLLICAAGITVLYLTAAEPLLMMFGASEQTLPYAMGYMNIVSVGAVFTLITMGLNNYLTTQGFSTFAMMTTVLGAVTNIILDPVFIFGFDLGVKGAALATVISQAVSATFVVWFLTKSKKSVLKIKLPNMRLEGQVIGPCLALGISGFVMVATESLLSISFNSSLQRFGGDLAVGSMTIITSCSQLASMPASGIAQGCQPIVGFNFGAGKHDRVKQCFYLQLAIAGGYTILFWLASMLVPQVFVQIFNNDPALVEHTVWAMRIYMAGIFSLGFQLTCQQSFIALGQAKISLFMACLRKLILLIPLIFILPMFFENKVFAVFLAEPVSDIIAALATTGTFFFRFDKILKEGAKAA